MTGLQSKQIFSDRPYRLLIAIPSLEESEFLPQTFMCLEQSESLSDALIAVHVNNRADASDLSKLDNQKTLKWLENYSGPLNVCWLDSASEGCELPQKRGVGLARKILIDACLDYCRPDALISWLDADTLTQEKHIDNLLTFEKSYKSFRAGYIDFEHQVPDDIVQATAINLYQRHLFYYENACRWAGSPYAYQTVGSTLLCRASEYRKASGTLTKRLAGEDFYFMQHLAKTGSHIEKVSVTKVYPSSRFSDRVPFGTGKSIAEISTTKKAELLTYDVRCFMALKKFLALVESGLHMEGEVLEEVLVKELVEISPFLKQKNFSINWDKLRKNSVDANMLRRRFHEWFDAFATLKFIHYLTENEYLEVPLADAEKYLKDSL